jgi:hypothetical protein
MSWATRPDVGCYVMAGDGDSPPHVGCYGERKDVPAGCLYDEEPNKDEDDYCNQ